MRAFLVGVLLLTAGIALLPEASAACEPNPLTQPICEGTVTERLRRLIEDIQEPGCQPNANGITDCL